MEQLKWDHGAKIEQFKWNLRKVRASTVYECEKCGFKHTDAHKPKLLRDGQWRAENTNCEPEKRGYHLNSLYPAWISFGEVAVMYLQSFGSPEEKQNFHNSWLALPVGSSEDRDKFEREIGKRADEGRLSTVPTDHVAILTVDVQRDRLYFVVRAHDRDKNSIRLEYGTLPGFEEAEVVAKKWGCPVAFVDSGYAARQREVLEWCAAHNGWIPTLGSAGLLQPMRWVDIPIDGGLMKGHVCKTLRVRPNDWKEHLHNRIQSGVPKWKIAGDPGEDYKKQMSAEVRHTRRGPRGSVIIEWIQVAHDNHYLDCEAMQIAGFESVRAFVFDVPEQAVKPPPSLPAKRLSPENEEDLEIARAREPRDDHILSDDRDKIW
jgi:hypothetical protein